MIRRKKRENKTFAHLQWSSVCLILPIYIYIILRNILSSWNSLLYAPTEQPAQVDGTSPMLGTATPSRDIYSGILKNITECFFPTSKEAYPIKLQNSLKFQALKERTLYCFQHTLSVSFKHYLYDAEAVYISHLRLWSWMTKLFSYTAYSKNKYGNTIPE